MSRAAVRERLAKALELLMAPAVEQLAWLGGTPHAADELALQLGECMEIVPMALREGVLTGAQAAAVGQVHDRLVALSGPEHANISRIEQLASSPEWSDVRRLAQAALQILRDAPPDG